MPFNQAHRSKGFTLVEIMIVLVIIGLIAAMALPAFQRVRTKARYATALNDLRTFSAAFDTYASENGAWPIEAASGIVPPEMIDRLKIDVWQTVTLGGGQWDWQYAVGGVTAAIAMTGSTLSDAEMAEFDLLLDDGNISTGRFRRIGAGSPTLVIAE